MLKRWILLISTLLLPCVAVADWESNTVTFDPARLSPTRLWDFQRMIEQVQF